MTAETHSLIASFIWGICKLLRGPSGWLPFSH